MLDSWVAGEWERGDEGARAEAASEGGLVCFWDFGAAGQGLGEGQGTNSEGKRTCGGGEEGGRKEKRRGRKE